MVEENVVLCVPDMGGTKNYSLLKCVQWLFFGSGGSVDGRAAVDLKESCVRRRTETTSMAGHLGPKHEDFAQWL